MKSELNPRQWALYNLLKNNPDKYFQQIEITMVLPEYYYDYEAEFHDSSVRLLITNDIRKINNSDVIQKIIISTRAGVKLANREEFEKYINGQFAAIWRKLARTRKKAKKGGLDGQFRFTFGNERNVVEAFTEDINRLKSARLAAGLKLADVARELSATEKGIDVPLISKMENGCCQPTERVLLKMALIYGVEPAYLLGGKITPEHETA